jgi:hypothetical protein
MNDVGRSVGLKVVALSLGTKEEGKITVTSIRGQTISKNDGFQDI